MSLTVKAVSIAKRQIEKKTYLKITDTITAREYSDLENDNFSFRGKKNNSSFIFGVSFETDANCCGIYSLGGFRVETNSSTITQKEKIQIIKEGLKKTMSILKKGSSEITVIFTLIDSIACDLVKEAVHDGEVFTKVKTFKNLNSDRINHLYVSN